MKCLVLVIGELDRTVPVDPDHKIYDPVVDPAITEWVPGVGEGPIVPYVMTTPQTTIVPGETALDSKYLLGMYLKTNFNKPNICFVMVTPRKNSLNNWDVNGFYSGGAVWSDAIRMTTTITANIKDWELTGILVVDQSYNNNFNGSVFANIRSVFEKTFTTNYADTFIGALTQAQQQTAPTLLPADTAFAMGCAIGSNMSYFTWDTIINITKNVRTVLGMSDSVKTPNFENMHDYVLIAAQFLLLAVILFCLFISFSI